MRYAISALVLAACGAPPRPAPAPAPAPTPTSAAAADGEIAPEATAGLYWLPYVTCDRCGKPAALAAYVTPDPATAQKIVGALDGKLGFGLPWVVHTDELAVAQHGIAVVIGTFTTVGRAAAAAGKAAPIAGVRPAVIDLATGSTEEFTAAQRHVTQIDRGAPVPAWSKADVDAVTAALDESTDPDAHQTMESQRAWVLRKLHARPPACELPPGALFVVEDAELQWYAFAPVRCAGKPAYVEWQHSLLGHAVIVPDGDGHRLYQVVGAECDAPIIEDWRYDAGGRHRATPEGALIAGGGC